MKIIQSSFASKDESCAGTLYLPWDAVTPPPVIVMAHGFGAIRAAGLMAFADRFVAAGYAAYLFDYRGFGDSDGEPRHWVSPRRHLQDWKAAIAHVRSLPNVDAQRVVLWGTSFSGGHVIRTAAEDHCVHAVIAQVPHVDGVASAMQAPFSTSMRLSLAGLRDVIGGLFGTPHYAPILGRPGDVAAVTSPEAWDSFFELLPAGARWENRTRARVFLELPLYSPIRHAHKIQAPTLILAGRDDTVTPYRAALDTARRIPNGRFELLDSNHFQLCIGDAFEKNIALQLEFLGEVLPTSVERQKSESQREAACPIQST